MPVKESLVKKETALSFEFFPTKTEAGTKKLYDNIRTLIPLRPAFVSVTYGAGGTTRKFTHDLLIKLKQDSEIPVVSHLTCVGHTKEELFDILSGYDREGIHTLMVLRGDPQDGNSVFEPVQGGFRYAYELVAFVKKHFPHMEIGVAGFPEGHPETSNRLKEIDYLKAKVDAGADYICTQFFFDNNDFYDFCERCEIVGINVPIIAGIMPITTISGMKKMAELALGTRFPAKLLRALSRADDDYLVQKVGVHWATTQVSDLIDNKVAGVHFYTLNKSDATRKIYRALGIKDSESLASSVSNVLG